jgi:hypothetical protein
MLRAEESAWAVASLSGLTVGVILGTQTAVRIEALGAVAVIVIVAVTACGFLLGRARRL